MLKLRSVAIVCALGVALLAMADRLSAEDLRAPSWLGDHAILQRDRPIVLRGSAAPGDRVVVRFAGLEATGDVDDDGRWSAALPAMSARATPTEMRITTNHSGDLTLRNLLVGDVWLGAGQSNMAWPLTLCAPDEIEHARGLVAGATLRLAEAPRTIASEPQADLPGFTWRAATPGNAGNFSAVLLQFGLALHGAIPDVPVGLVNVSWGGTKIEPFMPAWGFEMDPEMADFARSWEARQAAYQRRLAASASTTSPAAAPDPLVRSRNSPTAVYNAMVHPLTDMPVRGVLWYQGESSRDLGHAYAGRMRALVRSWRAAWDDDDLPFFWVQLPPYDYDGQAVVLPAMWEAQAAALELPNVGMAVSVDAGDFHDIHPRRKQVIGERLARLAMARVYGLDVIDSGPIYREHHIEGARVRVSFDHARGLSTGDDRPPMAFELAGEDGAFHPALAAVEGQAVIVSSARVPNPKALRYAWSETPTVNLVNAEGLPARPFRTDGP